jgi:hypothetical protein
MLFFPKGDPGLVSWNHIDDEVLLQWLDDAAGLLSNNIHNDESAHQSGTSFNTSAIIRTPSHSTNSLRDARWSSNNGLTTSKVLPGPPQDAEYANLDEPSIAFGGDSVPVDEKPNSSKRRYNAEELEKVNSVRASSACTRCQVMKEAVSHSITWKCALLTKSPQCSEDSTPGPCRRCQAIELSSRIWKTPCFRGQLTAAELFRTFRIKQNHTVAWKRPSPSRLILSAVEREGSCICTTSHCQVSQVSSWLWRRGYKVIPYPARTAHSRPTPLLSDRSTCHSQYHGPICSS